jgi:hypothetical protein
MRPFGPAGRDAKSCDKRNGARDRELGMDRPIARRDFLNGAAIAIGAALTGPAFAEQGESGPARLLPARAHRMAADCRSPTSPR